MTRILTRTRPAPPASSRVDSSAGMSLRADDSGAHWPLVGLITVLIAGLLITTVIVLGDVNSPDRVETSDQPQVFTLPDPLFAAEVSWTPVAGVAVPISRHHDHASPQTTARPTTPGAQRVQH